MIVCRKDGTVIGELGEILATTDKDLRDADLSGVDLSGVDLTGADLSEANLSDADLPRRRQG